MLMNILVLAFALSHAALWPGAQEKAAGSLTDVSGVWIMLIEGHQVGLELEQKDTAVLGVMLMMGQRRLLEGTYVDRTLTLKDRGGAAGGTRWRPCRPHHRADAGRWHARRRADDQSWAHEVDG